MMNTLLKTFTEHTYSQSDFAYRMSLLKEFLEYTFFKKNQESPGKETIDTFAKDSDKKETDINFLRTLPETFLKSFSRNSFYDVLKKFTEEIKHSKTIALTVPVSLSHADIEAIGVWVRKNVDVEAMIEIDVESSIAIGCQIMWNNILHDFSLNHYLTEHASAVHELLLKRTTVKNQT